MARSKSSRQWLREHFDDRYVNMAKKDGYRSRACYKLLEIQQRDRILRQGMLVVDLGAAPGSWSQVVAQHVGDSGKIVASDILPMDNLAGVDFIQGDFTESEILDSILSSLDGRKADLVISDMAPNLSGLKDVDQPRAMHLAELALEFAREVLRPDGVFLTKVFQGEGFEQYLRELRLSFSKVQSRKPDSSRPRSREVFLLARQFKDL